MESRYPDREIARLMAGHQRHPVRLMAGWGHAEREYDVHGEDDHEARIRSRQNAANPLDFSVILTVHVEGSHWLFRLRRCYVEEVTREMP